MYYPDMTPYEYISGCCSNLFNVGWLESGKDFPVGDCSEEFVEQLFRLCLRPVASGRGYHRCDFCFPTNRTRQDMACSRIRSLTNTLQYRLKDGRTIWTDQLLVQQHGCDLWLGSGEVQAHGQDGSSYRAPTLIYHYVVNHHYRPPQPFIDAVLRNSRRRSGVVWTEARESG